MIIRSIDFETTGEPKEDAPQAICEAGWCDVHLHLVDPQTGLRQPEIGAPQAMLVNPGRPMPPDARAVHHISDEDVASAPPPDLACAKLMQDRPDFFCAHNADFEREFFGGGGIPFICTYKVAVRLWPEAQSHSLQFLRYSLGLNIDQGAGLPAHRAGPDAYVGAALMARIIKHEEAPDLDTMVRWSNGPALLSKIAFGKHKGTLWKDVDSGFLKWIIDPARDFSRDVKATAKYWLKQKGEL